MQRQVLLQHYGEMCETIRHADVSVVFVRERTTKTPVDCVTEKQAGIFYVYFNSHYQGRNRYIKGSFSLQYQERNR